MASSNLPWHLSAQFEGTRRLLGLQSHRGLLHSSQGECSQTRGPPAWTKSSLNSELFLLEGNAADKKEEVAREHHRKEQNQLPLIV